MIVASRKDINEAIKWSKKNSPIAYFVLSMNGKWGGKDENPENIVTAFKRLWPDARAYLHTMAQMNFKGNGQLIPVEFDIAYPQPKIKAQIKSDFFDLITLITGYLDTVEDYGFLEKYCQDMDALFIWGSNSSDIWKGTALYAIDKQGRHDEAFERFKGYTAPGEKLSTMYAQALIDRADVARAEEVLGPYRDSADEDVQQRIVLLDRLKAVKLHPINIDIS